jgi:hypothetical protein
MCITWRYWKEMCALMAVIFGLSIASVCWGGWPNNVGPTSVTGLCYQQAGLCDNWSTDCISRGTTGYSDDLFTCGGVVYLYLQADLTQLWGLCQGESGECTKYDRLYCIHYNVYALPCIGSVKCDYYFYIPNGCAVP